MNPPEQLLQPRTEREVEHKFRVHGLFRLPDLHAVEGVAEVEDLGAVELESTYFDTPDFRLAREGLTLRRRTGDDEGWQLKVPADPAVPGVRDEIRLPLEAAADVPPEALLHVVRVLVRSAPVEPISILRTGRSTLQVRNGKGKPVAELVDDTVHVMAPDGTVTARFRELELEERKGGKVLTRVADALTSAGAVSGEFVAKVVRALGPAATAAPEIPLPPTPSSDDPAGDTTATYLARQIRALRTADITFRSRPTDAVHDAASGPRINDDDATGPGAGTDQVTEADATDQVTEAVAADQVTEADEAVHQMRVAARRLRGAVRTFRPLLDPEWARRLRAELAWFAHGLNDLRESEVLRARLRDHASELPDEVPAGRTRDVVDAELAATVQRARTHALELLESERYLALHEEFVSTAGRPPLTSAAQVPAHEALPGLVRDAWVRLAAAADQLTEQSPPAQWHAVRLRAKRTRYAAEAVALVLGDEAKAFARQLERLTDLLGEHQDAAQAVELLQRLAEQSADADVAAGLNALADIERGYAQAARLQFAAVWPHARRAKWRRWFTTP